MKPAPRKPARTRSRRGLAGAGRRPTGFGLAALALAACGPSSQAGAPWFQEEARARGLVFEHRSGHGTDFWMPEIMGGGAALFDLEQDGDLDVYLVQSGDLRPEAAPESRANALFENDGAGRFRDISAASGAEDPRYGMGVAAGDADGDGDTDLLVTNVGRNSLLLNQGRGRFEDATRAAGLELEGWSTSAAFFDADRDGALDLFVTRYLDWSRASELACQDSLGRPDYCSPRNYKTPARDLFYRGTGAGGFEDAARASGVWSVPGTGLGLAIGDLDADGWLDVFVANDGMPNRLWRNLGQARFEDVAMLAGCGVDANGVAKAGMGIALADFDEDLDLDVLVCNLKGESDSFYRNQGGYFADHTATVALAALSKPFTRFGLALGDFDQDGQFDLFQANGRVERPPASPSERARQEADPYAEANLLFRGSSEGVFEEVLPRGGTHSTSVRTSRAVVQGDVDGDGALDLLVVNRDAPAELLLNRAPGRGAGLYLAVLERNGSPALGAELNLELGSRRIRRDVAPGFGYLASHDARVHLGLGDARGVDGILVRWVDGTRERFGPLLAGKHVLRRGQGTPP